MSTHEEVSSTESSEQLQRQAKHSDESSLRKQQEEQQLREASSQQQQQEQQGNVPDKMKAARVVEFGKPLEFQEIDVPRPGPGEVLVRIKFCGICHTDLHMRNGDLSFKPNLDEPQTLGHEGAGEIVKTGPGANRLKIGDRVLCCVVASSCGCCADCLEGCETACTEALLSGCNKNGHLSQYVLCKEDYVCPIPDNLKYEEAAPINCAGVTSYKALKTSKLWCGQWLAILGAGGGLGYYAVQYAKAMGLKVIAIDKGEEKMKFLCKQFEGIHCVNADEEDVAKKVWDLTECRGVHGAIVLAPAKEAFQDVQKYLRKRGRLVVVGQPPAKEPVEFDVVNMIVNCHTVIGSLAGTRCDLMEALQLLSDGFIKSEATVREFDEVNDILDEIANEKAFGRFVVKIPGEEAEE